ncbi:MAG: hypothetical protein A2145_05600 [candidate division Zixibacteria bacterium RBG_16_40_9]|nr:MAG: hypothetical protein A2145_05600 [candidate division Zixibacteria bacterium RBG_16_40_9]
MVRLVPISQSEQAHHKMRVAVIDLGTNSVLLTVAQVQKNRAMKSLLEEKETPRLGENVDKTKKISPASIWRVLQTIQNFKKNALRLKAEKIILLGTAALREAKNTAHFKKYILKKTGLKLEVISGKEEAELAYKGATADFKDKGKKFTLLDIGGGSTEVIVGTSNKIAKLKSLNLGSLRLTERYLKNKKDGCSKMIKFITLKFKSLKNNFGMQNSILIGSGGTITTLGALSLDLKKYDRRKVHGLVLTKSKINSLLYTLENMSLAERKRYLKVDPERADIIIGGTIILKQFMETFGFPDILISDKSLRWGVLEELSSKL